MSDEPQKTTPPPAAPQKDGAAAQATSVKRVIRTYAQDLAAAQGKDAPTPVATAVTQTPDGTAASKPAPVTNSAPVQPPPPPAPPAHTSTKTKEAAMPATEQSPSVPVVPAPEESHEEPAAAAPATPPQLAQEPAPEKPIERPGIPLDMVVTRRSAQVPHESFLSRMGGLFAKHDEQPPIGDNVIHEDIQVADDETQQAAPQSSPVPSPEPATTPQHTMPITETISGHVGAEIHAPEPVAATQPQTTQPEPGSAPSPATQPTTPPQTQQSSRSPEPLHKDPSREAVLARLRAKVAQGREASERLVADSVLPQQQPAPTQPEPAAEKPAEPQRPPADMPSPIHTYKTDFSDRINSTGAAPTTILAAQQDASPITVTQPQEQHSRGNLWLAIGGAVILVLGIGGVFYAYSYNSSVNAPVVTKHGVPSLILADSKEQISGKGPALVQALAQAAQKPLPQGNVRLTYISLATTTPLGTTETIPLGGGYLIAAMKAHMPDLLLRNIGADSTVGVVHAGNQTRPFFILRVASYDAAFAGMLRWEQTIATDLAPLYPAYPTEPMATSTATSTAATSTQASIQAPGFNDEIIASHDARVLRDAQGRSVLMYGFWNKSTLVIARDPAAFTEILRRLQNAGSQ